jgi:outer membrane lipoprotein
MIKKIGYVLFMIFLIAMTSCAKAIPENVLLNIDKSITFNMLIKEPSAYKGKTVICGGEIIRSANENDGNTSLEIMELPLDSDYKPEKGDKSSGRFIALYKGYLETHIFSPGRFVTVVGVVAEPKKGTIGNMSYTFPVLDITYIKLWPIEQHYNVSPAYSLGFGFNYGPGPFPPWYYPFWY